MKKIILIFLLAISFTRTISQKQVLISDCTVNYSIKGSDAETNSNLAGTTRQFYLKGKLTRIDVTVQGFKESVVYDNNTGTAIILKEIGAEKYKSVITSDEWKQKNKRFEGLSLTLTNETKTILGYECRKAIATLKDGSSYNIYYATAIIPSASENPYQFKNVPGFVLEYETTGNNNAKITYTAVQINLNPVPALKFQIPTSGYRILKQ
ncbi:MAG: GLPGLI family protein [Panacibacter sp.]